MKKDIYTFIRPHKESLITLIGTNTGFLKITPSSPCFNSLNEISSPLRPPIFFVDFLYSFLFFLLVKSFSLEGG